MSQTLLSGLTPEYQCPASSEILDMQTICAWCASEIRPTTHTDVSKISHGVCLTCCQRFDLFPTQGIPSLAQSDVNLLPFGVIVLDRQGLILQYNSAESVISGYDSENVIGRDFFAEVAPCANVQEFAGRVAELQANGVDAREAFEFVFMFKNGALLVEIVCLFDRSVEQTTLLVAATP